MLSDNFIGGNYFLLIEYFRLLVYGKDPSVERK